MSSSNPSDPRDGTITRQEARDLLKALDKPEFSGLMDNYINEISDPNNIKETNQFLKESEAKKDLPSNVKLAKPSPGFCIRSSKFNIKRPSTRQKVFINICSYDGVSPPETTQPNVWSLPHLLNKGRHDQDKHKKICTTYDVVFHPKAISLANDNIAFKKFVCDTAIAGINNQLLAQTEEKISNDYVVKSKFNYKGLEISYINIHGLHKGVNDDRKEPSAFHKTEIMKEVERIKGENKQHKVMQTEEDEEKVYDLPDISGNINKDIQEQKEADVNEKTPIYKVKYSDQFDINNYFYRPEGVEEDIAQYKVIVIEIETPRMSSVADAELEIDVKRLKFTYKDVYLLEIALPVEIVKDNVKAKFDKGKKVLTVKADIVQRKKEVVKRKVSEDIEIVKDEKEEEEERKRKEKEEAEKLERERKEKEKKEKEEVFIKGIKKDEMYNNKEMPLKEVKFKSDDNNEENNEKEKEGKVLVQEVKPKENEESNKISIRRNPKDEDDQPQSINESTTTTTGTTASSTQKQLQYSEDTKTPISFLSFNNAWVYEVE